MTSAIPEILGVLVVVAAIGVLALIAACIRVGTRRTFPAPPLDETTETFDPRLLPLSDSEVAQRIRRTMDENAAVRQSRADLKNWSA